MDVCEFLNGTDNNPLMIWTMEAVADSFPKGLIHSCPYVGQVQAYNVSFALNGFTTQFLRGRYKGITRLFDEKDDNIITFKIGTEM
jgi:hypothetical protein